MPADRFFLDAPLKQQNLILSGEELHHLSKVMRAKVGSTIELVNGKGELAKARISKLGTSAELNVIEHSFSPPKPTLILAQAIVRPSLLDWIVEKGTELGASAFWFFPGDQSEKKELSSQQQKRLESLAISALKQSGRLYLPEIAYKPPLAAWKQPSGTLLFGDISPAAPKLSSFQTPVVFFVGPERGFSLRETQILHELPAKGVKLHDNTLRAETAVIAALSQLYLFV